MKSFKGIRSMSLSKLAISVRSLLFNKSRMIAIVVTALAITTLRAIIIYHYVSWRYLWGGDQVPIFNFIDLLDSIFKLSIIWRNLGVIYSPQLSLVLIGQGTKTLFSSIITSDFSHNVIGWVTNSLLFFLSALALYYVVTALPCVNTKHKLLFYAFFLLLFAFNPWSTIDTFKSYLGSTSLASAFLIILFAYYPRLLVLGVNKSKPRIEEILLIIALTIMLSTISPAGAVRLFVSLTLIEVIFLIILLTIIKRSSSNFIKLRSIITYSIIPIITTTFTLAFYIFMGYFSPLEHRVESLWGSLRPPEKVLKPAYANVLNSFKGMNTWIATSVYMPYKALYQQGLVAGLMMLWPITSLTLPLILLFSVRKKKIHGVKGLTEVILMLLLLAVIAIGWGTALNPPFTPIKEIIVSFVPIIPKVFPWSYSITYVKFIYMLLTSYMLSFLILTHPKAKLHVISKKLAKTLQISISLILLCLILVTALPIFNGSVFSQYFNPKIKGFTLPKDYEHIMKIHVPFYEHILLLPRTPTYTATSWGWQGSIAWYHTLNYAILTRTFAPYSEYTNWSRVYNELTQPHLVPINGFNLVSYINQERIKAFGAKVLSKHISDKGLVITINISKNVDHVDVIMPLKNQLNISGYRIIYFNFSIQGSHNLVLAPWFAIWSGKVGGWHLFPTVSPPAILSKTYAVGEPDKPWPTSVYYPSKITGFVLRLKILQNEKMVNRKVTIIISNITVTNHAKLSKEYLLLLQLLNIKYLIIDKSLKTFDKYYEIIDSILDSNYNPVYKGRYVHIYSLPLETQPTTILGCSATKILEVSPTRIVLEIGQCSNNALLVLPLLHANYLLNPLHVYIQLGGKRLELPSRNFNGLIAYPLHMVRNESRAVIVIELSHTFLALFMAYIAYTTTPLILLVVALTLRTTKTTKILRRMW